MIKQCVTSLAVAAVAAALAASAQAQSGIAVLSPAAQAEIQKLSPAQRAALAHSLLGDGAGSSNAAGVNPAAGYAPAMSSSVAQAGSVSTAPPAAMAPAPIAPAYDWNGCYLALGAGVGMFNDEHHISITETSPPATFLGANTTTGGNGLLGRFGAGCDYQVAPRVVLGAFGDLDLTNMSGTMSEVEFPAKESADWAWTAGARAGYLLWPQTLGYIDGGFTQARFHFANIGLPAGLSGLGALAFGGEFGSYVANGVFGGAGFEMALDFLPGAFWRNEYRFAYYVPMNDAGQIEGIPVTERVQPTVQTVTTSFVYKLDWNRFLH